MRFLRKKIIKSGFSVAVGAGIQENRTVATATSTETRFRYYEEAPSHLSVSVQELMGKLPVEFRSESGLEPKSGGARIDLPCRDLFDGNTPRLSLGQLHDLLPELVIIPEGAHRARLLSLPAGWVALHYHLVIRREELAPEALPSAGTPTPPIVDTKPPESGQAVEQGAGVVPAADDPQGEKSEAAAAPEEPKRPEGRPEEPVSPPPAAEEPLPADVKASSDPDSLEIPRPKRGFFASLPIFRRHQPQSDPQGPDQSPTPDPLAPVAAELAESKAEPITHAATPELQEQAPPRPLPVSEPKNAELRPETSLALTLEPLWKLDPENLLADPTALQALFMTEEKLTLERVIAMAGQFPGLRACVLAHGEQVVCASNTPTGIDIQTLSGQAMTMLAKIREASADMGIGAVPAVTLHAEQGALSFLHNGELCLLVLHADRGFLPGVRERLQDMLGHLVDARPALMERTPEVEGLNN